MERQARIALVFALVVPILVVEHARAQLPPPSIMITSGNNSVSIDDFGFDCLGPDNQDVELGCPPATLSFNNCQCRDISAAAGLQTTPTIDCGPDVQIGPVSQIHVPVFLKVDVADRCHGKSRASEAFNIQSLESCSVNYTVELNEASIETAGDIFFLESQLRIDQFTSGLIGTYCRGTECFGGEQDTLVTTGTFAGADSSMAYDIEASCRAAADLGGEITVKLDLTISLSLGSDCAQSASSMHWINPNGGSWNTDTNWNPQQVPVRDSNHADTAIFDLGAPFYTVDFTPGATADRMRVRNTQVGFVGSQLELFSFDSNDPSLSLGGDSGLTLTSGTIKCVHANIGDIAGTTQHSELSLIGDPSSKLSASGRVSVGVQGMGSLSVINGTLKCVNLDLVGKGTTEARFGGADAHGDIHSTNVGTQGPATLTIDGGAAVSGDFASVARDSSVIVKGTSSEGQLSAWSITNLAVGGGSSTGTLEILDGGSVVDTEAGAQVQIGKNGTVRVSGTPAGGPASQLTTRFLNVESVLTVEQEGRGECDDLFIGESQSPTSVTVETGGELKVNNELRVGNDNQPIGQLEPTLLSVSDSPGTEHVALTTDGRAGLFGPNSLLFLSQEGKAHFNQGLEVRPTTFARAQVEGPNTVAVVSNQMTVAGQTANAVASVVVQNGAAIVQPPDFGFGNPVPLRVGLPGEGPGDILISHPLAGFSDPIRAQMHFDRVDITRGQIRVEDAGLLSVDNNLTVGSAGRLEVVSTLLPVANAPNVKCNQLVINSGGVVRCCPKPPAIKGGVILATAILGQVGARIEGVDTVIGNLLTTGIVLVGCSPGTMTVQGNFEQGPEGVLVVQAAGLQPGQLDLLRVTGTATLGGTMKVLFQNGYLPKTGDTFPFIQADQGITGGFAAVSFPQLAPGFGVDFSTAGNALVMTALNDAVRAQVGDFDHDGDVDLDDYMQFELCSTGPTLRIPGVDCDFADFDGDNDVDEGDFDLFQRCFSGANAAADSDCAN